MFKSIIISVVIFPGYHREDSVNVLQSLFNICHLNEIPVDLLHGLP